MALTDKSNLFEPVQIYFQREPIAKNRFLVLSKNQDYYDELELTIALFADNN